MKALYISSAVGALAAAAAPVSAATLSHNRPFTNSCYVWAELQRGDARAVADCNRALSTEATTLNERAGTLVNRGIVLMSAKNYELAVRDFDAALQLDPMEGEAWLGKALYRWNAGDSRSSLEFADRALRYGTNKPALGYFIRGLSYELQGNLKAAYADLKQAQALDRSWAEPKMQLSRYRVVRTSS